ALVGPGPNLQTSILLTDTPSWRFGWVAGAGAETRLGNTNWLARLEYLHYDFGMPGEQTAVTTRAGATTVVAQVNGEMTVDFVCAGLSYKFGGVPPQWLASDRGPIYAKAPRAVRPWTWSGFYLGAHAGHGWGHDPVSALEFSPGVAPTFIA